MIVSITLKFRIQLSTRLLKRSEVDKKVHVQRDDRRLLRFPVNLTKQKAKHLFVLYTVRPPCGW
jgi:hypothetical protein